MNDADSDAVDGVTIDVRRGAPSEIELAALMAVVSEAYAVETAAATVEDAPRSLGVVRLAARPARAPAPGGRLGRIRRLEPDPVRKPDNVLATCPPKYLQTDSDGRAILSTWTLLRSAESASVSTDRPRFGSRAVFG